MITDFSGVMFDYALVFDKPFIYADTNFDKAPYDIDWLDENLWEMQILPKIGVQLKEKDFPNMENIIKTTIESSSLQAARDEIRNQAWQNRGFAAKKVVDYLIERQKNISFYSNKT